MGQIIPSWLFLLIIVFHASPIEAKNKGKMPAVGLPAVGWYATQIEKRAQRRFTVPSGTAGDQFRKAHSVPTAPFYQLEPSYLPMSYPFKTIKTSSSGLINAVLKEPHFPSTTDSLPHYPFIDSSANMMLAPQHIQPFLRKLKDLKNGQRQQVRIAHLGDSHVQADFMSTSLRRLFQERFGNAGRGLVFFYAQAGTHGPLDLRTSSPQEWIARRRIFQKDGPAIGISGMGIATMAPVFSLGLSPKKPESSLRFNKATLFHDGRGTYEYHWETLGGEKLTHRTPLQNNWRNYTVRSGDTLYKIARQFNCTVAEIRSWNNLSSDVIFPGQELSVELFAQAEAKKQKHIFQPTTHPQSSVAYLPERSSGIRIHGQRKQAKGEAQIYGLLLEDGASPGVLFNMMGVNGATYYHFNHAEHFTQQMGQLQPDLIIITLGTNEAIQSRFDPKQFRQEVSELLAKLKGVSPESDLLLMTNPSVLVQRRKPAPYTLPVREIIREVAAAEGAAVWDWYAVMGGRESIRDWREAELAYKDFIHFTEKGYILQARLLFDAIMKKYRAGH